MASYIAHRHQISPQRISETEPYVLKKFLASLSTHARATYAKLINRWAPTYEFLHKQGREVPPLCPQCNNVNKSADHVYQCQATSATDQRQELLSTMLETLRKMETPQIIVTVVGIHLSKYFHIPVPPQYVNTLDRSTLHPSIHAALRHQNLIGWDTFIRGYISRYWNRAFNCHNFTNVHNSKKNMDSTIDVTEFEITP